MARSTFVFPILLILLLALSEVSLTHLHGATLRDRIESTSEELGVPIWKAWDAWWQLQSCKSTKILCKKCNWNSFSKYFPFMFIQRNIRVHQNAMVKVMSPLKYR